MRETPSISHVLKKSTDDDKPGKAKIQKKPWYLNTFLTNFFSGGTSAALAVTAIAPFERIKLILQVQKSAKSISPEQEYKGIMDCLRRIPKEQGILSFWRGNSASVLRCFPYQALNFSVKDKLKEMFHKSMDITKFSQRILTNLLAGGIAGSTALALIYPLDYARTRLAVDMGGQGTGRKREFNTIRETIVYTWKKEGRAGIYRGFSFSVLGVFVYRSIYFGIFDTGVELLSPQYRHAFWAQFIIAELSAICGSTISYPLDTVRRSMMMQSGRDKKLYQTSWECYRKIYVKYGLSGFYHGGLANIVRGTGGALMLILYDKSQTHFNSVTQKYHAEDIKETNSVQSVQQERVFRLPPSGLIDDKNNQKRAKNPEKGWHFCQF